MKLKTNVILVLFLLGLYSNEMNSQVTIWSEGFTSYSNGAMIASDNNPPVGPDWTIGACVSCASDASDWWEVRSNRFEARDVNNETPSLKTEVIDISGFSSVSFSVLVTESGDHEGIYLNSLSCIDEDNEDFADVSFRIDGGPWQKIINYLNWCGLYNSCGMHTLMGDEGSASDCRAADEDWVSANVTVGGLSGSTLEILCEARNSAGTEYIQFDNILVQGFLLLPVSLSEFKAEVLGDKVDLNWATLSELNNDFFEIHRSTDLLTWTSIGTIDGSGTTTEKQEYLYVDYPMIDKSGESTFYYRLLQVDFNGNSEFSNIVSAQLNSIDQSGELLIIPNPVINQARISFQLVRSEIVEIEIYNFTGQIVSKSEVLVEKGRNTVELESENLIPGNYIVRVNTSDSSRSVRLLKR